MKKYLYIPALFLLLIAACNEHSTNEAADDTDSTTAMPADSIITDEDLDDDIELYTNKKVSPPTNQVSVYVHSTKDYGVDSTFAIITADTLQVILNSVGFKRAVLNTTFEYYTNDMNSQQIYDTIMRAHEVDGPGGNDGVVDLRLRIITREEDGRRAIRACNRKTVGIDGSGSGIAAVCPQWLRYTAEQKHYSWLAAHFIHEYMHILDFRHPNHKSESVPYIIQSIVEKLVEHPEMRN